MLRSIRAVRPTVLFALAVAVACTDQPTEPTEAVDGFQAALAPPPAPPTVLSGELAANEGGPSQVDLGDFESPVYSKVTVSGLLGYQGAGGYLPGTGQIDASGVVIQNQCDLMVVLRSATGPIYASPSCPSQPRRIDTYIRYAVVNGHLDAYRTTGPPGSCWKYPAPCIHFTGSQSITVEPQEGLIVLTPSKTSVAAGGGIIVTAKGVWDQNPAIVVPMTVRAWTWEGSGPEVGGGHTKVCAAYNTNQCTVQVYQSGRVVLEALVNGKVKTQSVEIAVVGGDTLPLPPPPDTMPDEPPGDSGGDGDGGGGGGGGGGGCPGGCCGQPMPAGVQLTQCQPDGPQTLQIVSHQTPSGDNSFLAASFEKVHFSAKTERLIETAEIKWSVRDAPDDLVNSEPAPFVQVPTGATVDFSILAPEPPSLPASTGNSRWYAFVGAEPGDYARKPLAVEVRAYIVRENGDTLWSDAVRLQQIAIDVVRQEYVDLTMPWVPVREDLEASTGGYFFTVGQLAAGTDYWASHGLAWVHQNLPQGLDLMGAALFVDFRQMTLTNGYRNPVHNWMHMGLSRGKDVDRRSRHQIGAAADVATFSRAMFYELSEIGAQAGACMEPPLEWLEQQNIPLHGVWVTNWDHVHVEWSQFGGCPGRMQQWSESLLQ